MNASVREIDMLMKVAEKVNQLGDYLNLETLNKNSLELSYWYSYIAQIKKILGNFDNDVSFIACLMAKAFLCKNHSFAILDVATKSQSAPGLDIDKVTIDGDRVIAEIKTTVPYGETDLGSQQKETFYKDFEKLQNNAAAYKYFFVTELRTFNIVKQRYLGRLEGVTVVLLPHELSELDNNCINELSSAATMRPKIAIKNLKPSNGTGSRSIINKGLADRIRAYINREILQPARETGVQKIRVKSADISSALKLTSRYPAICSAMEGSKIEKDFRVQILIREGTYGAKFIVTYEL